MHKKTASDRKTRGVFFFLSSAHTDLSQQRVPAETSLFSSFPYVCPEAVLANIRLFD
jgi:hypothetical protein